jgi:hypothetical protein
MYNVSLTAIVTMNPLLHDEYIIINFLKYTLIEILITLCNAIQVDINQCIDTIITLQLENIINERKNIPIRILLLHWISTRPGTA